MKLMTKEILGKLKSNPRDTAGNKPWLKLFNPTGSGTWLISEIEDDGDTMFGLCDLGHGSPELGYVSLNELPKLKTQVAAFIYLLYNKKTTLVVFSPANLDFNPFLNPQPS